MYKSATKMYYYGDYWTCYGILIVQSEVWIYAKYFIIILIFGQYLSFIQSLQLECKINAGAE